MKAKKTLAEYVSAVLMCASGVVLIAESHMSIHTFPKRGFLSADIYTCKNGLDVKAAVLYFKSRFGLKSIERHFIKRGTKYPQHNLA